MATNDLIGVTYDDGYVWNFKVTKGTEAATVGVKAVAIDKTLYVTEINTDAAGKLVTDSGVISYVAQEIAKLGKLELRVVTELGTPGENTLGAIYLVSKGEEKSGYREYITVKGGTEASPTYAWEEIGDTEVSLEDYYTKNEVVDLLDDKVDKDGTKVLSSNDYTNDDKNKLADISEGANKVEASNINGKIKIDGKEVTVYTAPEEKYAFDSIKVGDKKASAAEGKTTLAITAGTGISITTTTEKESGGPAIEISATGTEAQSATVNTAGIVKLPTFTEGCIDLTRV